MTPELSFALLGQWMFFGVVQQFHFMLKTLVHRYISSSISEILNWPAEITIPLYLLVIWIMTITVLVSRFMFKLFFLYFRFVETSFRLTPSQRQLQSRFISESREVGFEAISIFSAVVSSQATDPCQCTAGVDNIC